MNPQKESRSQESEFRMDEVDIVDEVDVVDTTKNMRF